MRMVDTFGNCRGQLQLGVPLCRDPGQRIGPAMTFTVTLPLPPSTNALYIVRKGKRIKNPVYRSWLRWAILRIIAQVRADRGIRGPVSLSFCVPTGMRGDIDNRLKATIDALVKSNRIDDDKHVHSITILRGGADKGTIEVKAVGV